MAEGRQFPFANRIVRLVNKRASTLTANPANWRTHPQQQRDAVNASLSELGWIAPVIENIRTGYLIDGHERVWQAMGEDMEVPVLEVDLSEEEERLALATYDPLTMMAHTDQRALGELLAGVSVESEALQGLLQGLADEAARQAYSPAIMPSMADNIVTDLDVARARALLDSRFVADHKDRAIEQVCPHCGRSFFTD